jgi:hypothetical protein
MFCLQEFAELRILREDSSLTWKAGEVEVFVRSLN